MTDDYRYVSCGCLPCENGELIALAHTIGSQSIVHGLLAKGLLARTDLLIEAWHRDRGASMYNDRYKMLDIGKRRYMTDDEKAGHLLSTLRTRLSEYVSYCKDRRPGIAAFTAEDTRELLRQLGDYQDILDEYLASGGSEDSIRYFET